MTLLQTPSVRHPTPDDVSLASSDRVISAPAEVVAQDDASSHAAHAIPSRALLYTPEQKIRRDQSPWTMVQGLLAPLQLLAMFVSVALVVRFLGTGQGLDAANASVIIKTLFLYVIMVTGAIWEKDVFGQYLFHEKFFWEDVVSMGVIALHTAYLYGLYAGWDPTTNLRIALAGYAFYTVNATQFLLKLRAARLADAAIRAAVAAPGAPA